VRKNRHVPQMSGANCYGKLSYSKQLLKNIHPMMLAQFHRRKRYLQCSHRKPPKNHQPYRPYVSKLEAKI